MLEKLLWAFNKEKGVNKRAKVNSLVGAAKSLGYSFLGGFDDCGEYIASNYDYYMIQKKNVTAFSMKNKIVQKVWKNWLYLQDPKTGEAVEDNQTLSEIIDFFSTPSFHSFKNDYFTQYFASGDVYVGVDEVRWKLKAKVTDSRTMKKLADKKTGDIIWYKQTVKSTKWSTTKRFTTEEMYNNVVLKDPDNPHYGMSIYVPILYDALASQEISRRNFYFFKNDAKPWVFVAFEPEVDWISKDEYKQVIKDFEERHQWTKNTSRVMGSNYVRDIKLIESNHKDLELIKLDTMTIKKFGMLFQVDPRLLGFSDDVGAYATMNEIGKHSLEAIQTYQNNLEQDMNIIYRMFVDDIDYVIRLDWDTFEDRQSINEWQRKDIEHWIITVEEARSERWLPTEWLPDWTRQPLIKTTIWEYPANQWGENTTI